MASVFRRGWGVWGLLVVVLVIVLATGLMMALARVFRG